MPSPSFKKFLAGILLAAVLIGLAHPSPVCGGATDLTGEFAIETWTTDNGMPHNSVTALLQTRQGYIWASTYNGIAQFDGDRFKVFDASNTKGLEDSRITALYEDAQGVIWIGHDRGEVTRCVDGQFAPVVLDKLWGNASVIAFGNDEHGDLWVLNLGGEALRLRDSLRLEADAPNGGGSHRAASAGGRCPTPPLRFAQRGRRPPHTERLPGGKF